jgi:hypothetical protein
MEACWQHISIHWDLATSLFQMIVQAKQHLSSPFFMEFFIVDDWKILLIHRHHFDEEAKLQAYRFSD